VRFSLLFIFIVYIKQLIIVFDFLHTLQGDGLHIEIAFCVSSFLATIINYILIKVAKESPVLIQQPQSLYSPLNSSYGQHMCQQSYSTFDNVDGNLQANNSDGDE